MTMAINEFQRIASEQITALGKASSIPISFDRRGNTEPFLVAELPSHGLTIWVYEDELEFKCKGLQRLLESPDFGTQDEMLEFFLSELSTVFAASKT